MGDQKNNTKFENAINTCVKAIDVTVASRDIALEQVVDVYSTIPGSFDVSPETISDNILKFSQAVVTLHNANLTKADAALKWSMPKSIEPFQLARCIIRVNHAINLSYVEDSAECEIAVYCESGIQEGLYTTDMNFINNIIYSYHTGMPKNALDEVLSRLKAWAPQHTRTSDPDLIPVNNGIFNYKTKTLMDFSPDFIFLTKSRTNYNPNATNTTIMNQKDGSMWDVESWMADLTDDPEITNLLWEITGALLRPNVAWNKSAWLYSDRGENGKGTLCAMWRNLCGSAATSIPISDFSKDFMLSSLTTAQAIIVDENDVGAFIDRAGSLKAVITNDVVYINRKFKDPIHYQFHGFMVQCLNELPRFRDKSDSIYRRQLFVPMNKCFTGFARAYIKNDYINRKEVLEYVMKRVLEMDYYTLSEPEACTLILNEYKIYNDPVRQFWTEFENQFVWDLLPYTFLYSLYKEWFKRDNPSGSIIGRNTFMKDLLNVINKSDVFTVPKGCDRVRTGNSMNATETLIAEYNLTDWQTPGLNGKSATVEAMCRPVIAESYRGLVRIKHDSDPDSGADNTDDSASNDTTDVDIENNSANTSSDVQNAAVSQMAATSETMEQHAVQSCNYVASTPVNHTVIPTGMNVMQTDTSWNNTDLTQTQHDPYHKRI